MADELSEWRIAMAQEVAVLKANQHNLDERFKGLEGQLTWLNRFVFGVLVTVIVNVLLIATHIL